MRTEFEAKFLCIDHESFRTVLQQHGAKLEQPMRLMKRVVIETPALRAKGGFLRIRDQGDKATLTYKQFDNLSVDGAKEYEVEVSNFQETINILSAANLPYHSYQESRRETWSAGDVEVVLDEWPWLAPFIEIEGSSEQAVRDTAMSLGLNWSDAVFGDVMAAYRAQYPHLTEKDTIGTIVEVRFADPLPEFLQRPVHVK